MKIFKTSAFIALLLLTMGTRVIAQEQTADNIRAIIGFWLTKDKDAVVEIYPCGQNVCGKFHWLKDDSPEAPSLDDKNPDPALKSRPLCGLQFLGDFELKGQGFFDNGWIYSPRHGSNFSGSLKLKDNNTLELRGYVLIPLFGDSQYWTRTGPNPVCKTSKK